MYRLVSISIAIVRLLPIVVNCCLLPTTIMACLALILRIMMAAGLNASGFIPMKGLSGGSEVLK